MELLPNDLFVLGTRNDMCYDDLCQKSIPREIWTKIVTCNHSCRHRYGQAMNEIELAILELKTNSIWMSDGNNSSSLALNGISAGHIPQIEITLGL